MAHRFSDSFDHYNTAGANLKGWTITDALNVSTIIAAAEGRNGSAGIKWETVATNSSGRADLGVPNVSGATFIASFSVKRSAIASELPLITVLNGSVNQSSFNLSSSGAILHRRGQSSGTSFQVGTLLGTSTETIPSGIHTHVEIKLVLATTATGSVQINITGVSALTLTSVITAGSGTIWSGVRIGATNALGVGVTSWLVYDDLILLDGSGAAPLNDLIGDHAVICRVATGAGASSDWSPTAGANWTNVDENPQDTATLVASGTVGHRDLYTYPALGVTGVIVGIQQVLLAKADAAGIREVDGSIRVGATNYASGAGPAPLGSDWQFQRFFTEKNPATVAAWAVAEVDAAQFGEEVTT